MFRYSTAVILLTGLLPTYLIRFSVFGVPTNLFEAAVVVVFVWGTFQPHVRAEWKEAAKQLPHILVWLIGLFIAASVISTLVSPHLYTSLGILKSWILLPIVFGFMVFAAKSRELVIGNWKLVIEDMLIFSGVVVALLGISQIGTLDRVKSIFDVPNSLALFLAPLIILSWMRGQTGPSPFAPRGSYLFVLIMFVALLATRSFMGIISVIIVLVAQWFLLKSNNTIPRPSPLVARTLLLLFLISIPVLVPKLHYLAQPNSSTFVRLQLWSISWELIQEHPITGIGLGTFEPFYQQKLHERFTEYENSPLAVRPSPPLREFVFRDPHNWLLSFWLNVGLLGLSSFIAIHAYLFYWAFNPSPFTPRGSYLGIVLTLAILFLFGLTDTIYWKNDLAVLHWIFLSLTLRVAVAPSTRPQIEG